MSAISLVVNAALLALDIQRIARSINAAVLEPERWTAALESVCAETGSFGAVLFPMRGSLPYVPGTQSMGECFEVYVRDGWVERDERTIRGLNKLIARGIVTDADIVSEEIMRKSPYYQDFLAKNNLKGWAAVKVGSDGDVWSLTFHRTLQQEPFSASELAALHELSFQLSGTTEIAAALGFARGAAALEAFDMSAKAALLLDRYGNIVRVNRAAEQLFDADISLAKGRLISSNKNAAERFEDAVRRLLWSSDQSNPLPISLPRPGRNPILVHLMRSFQLADTPLSSFHAVAVLIDPDARHLPTISSLKIAFDLTPAEARLAIALHAGSDIQSEAHRLNLSRETLRKQLRSIFEKARVSRQSDLIATLSNFLSKL